jgi:hypothetical protein
MIIKAEPDMRRPGWPFGGRGWAHRIAPAWRAAHSSVERYHALDLSNLRFTTLFDWVSAVAMMERLLADNSVLGIDIDLVGNDGGQLLSYGDYLTARQKFRTRSPSATPHNFAVSRRVYTLLQFIQSLGTRDVLNGRGHAGRVAYVKLSEEITVHYTRGQDPTMLLTRRSIR